MVCLQRLQNGTLCGEHLRYPLRAITKCTGGTEEHTGLTAQVAAPAQTGGTQNATFPTDNTDKSQVRNLDLVRSRRPFEIRWEARHEAWTSELRIVFSRLPAKPGKVWPKRLIAEDAAPKAFRGFLASALLHVSVFLLFAHHAFGPRPEPSRPSEASPTRPLFIDMRALKNLKILRALPVVKPSGRGGKPGTSGRAAQTVLQASTAQHPTLTIVVNPLKPETSRQAIQQQLSAPDLKIQVEQNVPDILLAEKPAVRKPQIDMAIHQPLARENASGLRSVPAPTVASATPALAMKIVPSVRQPQLPVSYFTANSLRAPSGGDPSARPPNGTSTRPSEDSSGNIVVVSVDPAAFSQLATLAQGNRYAAIAIAPSKEGAGSPGGSSNGTAAAGAGGAGKGGDASSGVGPGHAGGGGGGAERFDEARLNALGGTEPSGGVDVNKMLSPVAPSTVFAINTSTKPRRAPVVVSTGPIGGGGLDIYGALTCGKVYSIFLPMPGRSWVLQYCPHQAAEARPAQTNAGVVRMEVGLVPPSTEQQFDFRRLPVPETQADKLIVLRGTIETDGSISAVQVFRGVLPEMDARAAQAFRNWKFKPATRAGIPISVDVLVGVPARLPQEMNGTSNGGLKTP
jgi:hypothetical protein